jgi:UDP-N-acetylmuramoyl-tripeptide--D-alanyl-D-alanine ligase
MHTGAVHEGSWGEESVLVPDTDAAWELLCGQLAPGDVVLLKSSRDAGLRYLGDRLVEQVPTQPDQPDSRVVPDGVEPPS